MQFAYPCPGCRTTNNLHDPDCRFAGRPHSEVEKAYIDLLSVLTRRPISEQLLRDTVADRHGWDPLHAGALSLLRGEDRLDDTPEGLELPPPAERRDRLREPDHDALRTIYEEGSVPGAHDNAVFAMIAYYEMVGFSWPETRDLVVDWLRESGTWARGGFEESDPEELLEKKRHVYDAGYGWKEKATAAANVIEHSV